jgi:hypothetical protein
MCSACKLSSAIGGTDGLDGWIDAGWLASERCWLFDDREQDTDAMTPKEFKELLASMDERIAKIEQMRSDVERLAIGIDRLIGVIEREMFGKGVGSQLELIRQYVRGDLEPQYETTVEQPGPHDGPPFPYWKER